MSEIHGCQWLNSCATKNYERYLMCIQRLNDHHEQCERHLIRGMVCDKSFNTHCSIDDQLRKIEEKLPQRS